MHIISGILFEQISFRFLRRMTQMLLFNNIRQSKLLLNARRTELMCKI